MSRISPNLRVRDLIEFARSIGCSVEIRIKPKSEDEKIGLGITVADSTEDHVIWGESPASTFHRKYETCRNCSGTGISEYEEYGITGCHSCQGRGFVPRDGEDRDDHRERVGSSSEPGEARPPSEEGRQSRESYL